MAGQCQTYYVCGGVNGGFTFRVSDGPTITDGSSDEQWPEFGSGGGSAPISYFEEMVFLDTVAGTIRQTGTVVMAASSATVTFNDTEQFTLPPVFPNPPVTVTVTGVVTVCLNFGGGSFSFDTGTKPASWNGYSFSFDGTIEALTFPMSGSYVLVTGGETNTGSFTYSISAAAKSVWTFTSLTPAGYPESVVLSGNGGRGSSCDPGALRLSGGPAPFTASNGYQLQFYPGVLLRNASCYMGWGYPIEEYWNWSSTVTATRVSGGLPASITSQPQSTVVHAHHNASFSVTATGTPPH